MGEKAKLAKVTKDRGRHLGKADPAALHDRSAKLRDRDLLKADPHAVSRRLRPARGTT